METRLAFKDGMINENQLICTLDGPVGEMTFKADLTENGIDGKLSFCCLTPTIEKTFHIMGLSQYAGIYPDEENAVGTLTA